MMEFHFYSENHTQIRIWANVIVGGACVVIGCVYPANIESSFFALDAAINELMLADVTPPPGFDECAKHYYNQVLTNAALIERETLRRIPAADYHSYYSAIEF